MSAAAPGRAGSGAAGGNGGGAGSPSGPQEPGAAGAEVSGARAEPTARGGFAVHRRPLAAQRALAVLG